MATTFTAGSTIDVAHPFVREKITLLNADGPYEASTWRPGIRYDPVPPDSAIAVADGIGSQTLTIVSVHKPGRFPTRIFYTRQWTDPTGKSFGKGALLTKTSASFARMVRGYRVKFHLATEPTEGSAS